MPSRCEARWMLAGSIRDLQPVGSPHLVLLPVFCGRSISVLCVLPKHERRVRFPPPAPAFAPPSGATAGRPAQGREQLKIGGTRSEGCPPKPEGRRRAGCGSPENVQMHYVYLLESVHRPQQRYVGHTDDLKRRLREHNDGKSPHTAKHRPWNLVSYHAFPDEKRAVEFEHYLKTDSGRAFAKRHLGF